MENMLISPVKREKIKKLQQQKRKTEMRSALPVLTREEIRRYRLPLHEALLAELEENHYKSSKEYLEQLIFYQKTIKEREGPNSIIWLWPDLINEHAELEKLYKTLKAAEKAQIENNTQKEFDELVQLGVHYAFGDKVWWWLGEQLLILCSDVIENFATDGHKREAFINYIYGRFLTLNKKETEKAIPYLVKARSLSKSMSWTVKLIQLNRKEENVYIESCYLLFSITFQQALEMQYNNPIKAIDTYELARKYASNACNRSMEADGLLYQGICYLEAGYPRHATVVLLKSLLLNEKLERHEDVCKARINLALAYIKVDNFDEAIKHLEALKRYAEDKNLPYYIGQTYRYLGEYYINQGEPKLAIPILEQAVLIFHSLNAAYERLQVNNFCSIARGQLLLKKYIHLIIRSGYPDTRHYLMALIDWKDSRVKFCEEEETDDDTNSIDSTMAVYRIQRDEVSDLTRGMSRLFLSSIQLTRLQRDDSTVDSSVSTPLSRSLSSILSKSSDNDLSQIKTISSIESDIQRGKFVKRKSVQIADIDSIESAKKISFENIEMEYFDTEHFENVEVESIDVTEKFYTEEAFDLKELHKLLDEELTNIYTLAEDGPLDMEEGTSVKDITEIETNGNANL